VPATSPRAGATRAQILHLALFLAALSLASVMIIMPLVLGGHPVSPESGGKMFQYLTGGVALSAVLVAIGILRSRVPRRREGEPLDQYWSGPALTSALVTWAVLEGAVTIAAAGYLVVGGVVTVFAAVAGLATLLALGPGRLASR